MSKYDQYIKEYLLKNSELSIEKIGDLSLPAGIAGEKTLQPQFITFKFNKRAQTSEGLAEFIAAQTGKNKVLISSDLTSIFEDARQYANIGKAFSLAGLGNISLNRHGEYEFSAANDNTHAAEMSYTISHEKGNTAKSQAGRNAVIFLAFLIIILVAGGLGWGIYKYLNQKKAEPVGAQLPAAADTTKSAQNNANPAAQNIVANNVTSDSSEYKFIFETTRNSFRAYKRYDSLKAWRENCLIDSIQVDSGMLYHLYVTLKASPKDTTNIKDSLQKYYDRPNAVIIRNIN
ncbi:MAG TPA: hypothetical protein VG738_07655 [Chitinophagaceae bacterium]|nr:hypothetical protein [Chitinophagaceae bacterium]